MSVSDHSAHGRRNGMSIGGRVAPDSATVNVAHRVLMMTMAPRLAGRRDHSSRAIARALHTTALGRAPADERAWVARIEERRRSIAASAGELPKAIPYWSIPRIWGRFLMRLVRELEPRSCLELGMGFGLSACYQAAALELTGSGRLVTLDQEESLARIARQGFDELGLEGLVEPRMGAIGRGLPGVVEELAPIEYAYIDAEHTYAATVENFETLLPHLVDGGVVVVDDIKLSQEMQRAWDAIRGNERVALELGLRRIGIVVVSVA